MKKFSKISLDTDTKIHNIDYKKIDGFDSRHEIWSWDGIMGESLIFCKKDFKNPEKKF